MIGNLIRADWLDLGSHMYGLAEELFPLHRSITGEGVRKSFELLKRTIPLKIEEVASGTRVFDWQVPQEWQVHNAWIADRDGNRVVDYQQSNLHLVNYSGPVDAWMDWQDLEPHVHSLPDMPGVIPYRTTYFRDNWGFCVTGDQLHKLRTGGPWRVLIDSQFFEGSLSLGEVQIGGRTEETMLFYCHTCHPSLANDNLSGMVVSTYLAKLLASLDLRLTYRFVFAPATIGAITWLARQSRGQLDNIKFGLVLSLLGDGQPFTYKQSRRETALIDRLVPHVMDSVAGSRNVLPFSPFGYDERQFCSAGINLPVGRLTRSVHGEFSEYHTSADNLELVTASNLADSLQFCVALVESLEANSYPVNKSPCGEVQLGRRDLYRAFGEHDDRGVLQQAMMWVLNLSDGEHDLVMMAERSKIGLRDIQRAADLLTQHDLLEHQFRADPRRFNRYLHGDAHSAGHRD